MPITKFGQEWIARTEFEKGLGFIGAWRLLEPYRTDEAILYVRLHLICQGIELVLKSALLAKDYGKYEPRLHNPRQFGHDLVKIADAVETEFGFSKMRPTLRAELEELARLYSAHHLRYSGLNDIFIHPHSIKVGNVIARARALTRLMNREFCRANFGRP